jgi:hypothetical protein
MLRVGPSAWLGCGRLAEPRADAAAVLEERKKVESAGRGIADLSLADKGSKVRTGLLTSRASC